MYTTLFTVALFAASALRGVLADDELAINSPTINQCTPVKVSWQAGTAPYNLLVVSSDDPCGEPISNLGDHNLTYYEWTPKVKSGTKIMLSLLDEDGLEGWSNTITVGDGDDSCLSDTAVSSAPSVVYSVASSVATELATAVGNVGASPSETAQIMGGASQNDPLSGAATTSQVNMLAMVVSAAIASYALL